MLLLEVVPRVMGAIRREMRRRGGGVTELSVAQLRALLFIYRNRGASLSDVATHLGLTPSSTSRLVNALVARKLVIRTTSGADRRLLALRLTRHGATVLESARLATAAHLAEFLQVLSADERETVTRALESLRPLFAPGQPEGSRKEIA